MSGSTATKTRVLQVTHDLDVGGLQRVVQTLCTTIDRSRFDIAVLCVRAKGPLAGELEAAGVPVIDLERPANRPDYFPFRRVARVLRERRVEVVHTHNTEPFISGGIGAILAGTPTLIHTDHARPFPDKLRYMAMERLLSYRAHRVVGVSEHTSQNLLRYVKMPRRKVMTIPNGIDGGPFEIPTDRGKKRAELGITGSGPVVGLGVRLVTQKGIVYLLRAVELLKAQIPDIQLVIAGEGPLRHELQDAALQLGIDQNVRFVGVRSDMPEVIQTFDVYALPSLWEGLPLVLLEAMAAGCPIVATDVGGVRTAVTDGVNGSLVPPQDPSALAEQIGRLLRDDDLRARYRRAGKQKFQEQFSSAAMTRRYESLYLRQPD